MKPDQKGGLYAEEIIDLKTINNKRTRDKK